MTICMKLPEQDAVPKHLNVVCIQNQDLETPKSRILRPTVCRWYFQQLIIAVDYLHSKVGKHILATSKRRYLAKCNMFPD